ncbi:Na+/H+ antiporter NhaC family protein [Streptomyces sp. NPDC056664]|uniref:Na+/H+ antiporter NhaC family protein n=1 Tax=unclassified Streptomyces TaxID=2593676 RepID=UPI0036CA8FD6
MRLPVISRRSKGWACRPANPPKTNGEKRGPAPTDLSRPAADSGTVTPALVPWKSCGAFVSAALGVHTLSYAPSAIFDYAR